MDEEAPFSQGHNGNKISTQERCAKARGPEHGGCQWPAGGVEGMAGQDGPFLASSGCGCKPYHTLIEEVLLAGNPPYSKEGQYLATAWSRRVGDDNSRDM